MFNLKQVTSQLEQAHPPFHW